jgi:acetyl-CoA carboxylase biotin carboxylase subunit
MKKISRVFVANRGEIAVRIIRACHEIGIQTVLGVSEIDRESLAAKTADRVICIGPPQALKSYLSIPTIITAAKGTGCDAIHPGYGFLAEIPALGEACVEHGLIFIGPRPENIRKMGDKLEARRIVAALGIPVIPGSELVQESKAVESAAKKIGFPLLLKAAAGGGGKGMKIVQRAGDLKELYDEASAEALSAFGDGRIYIERFIPNARHIEIQVLADKYGKIIHLFERDCSLQRRYQKVVEEAPSPAVSDELRNRIGLAAIRIARHIMYENAGTIETILDQDAGKFYFLEMNTRIQVEHPVTELVTGVDLVKEQISIARGDPLSFSQDDIRIKGHAIECRINAESAVNNFLPNPGRITRWVPPCGPQLRIDSHCFPGYYVPPYYDSLLAKLLASGIDRPKAIEQMRYALENFLVEGIETNIPFLSKIIQDPDFTNGKTNTRWLENVLLRA